MSRAKHTARGGDPSGAERGGRLRHAGDDGVEGVGSAGRADDLRQGTMRRDNERTDFQANRHSVSHSQLGQYACGIALTVNWHIAKLRELHKNEGASIGMCFRSRIAC